MTRAASPREIARIFSVSPTRVYEAIRGGYVESHALGRKSLVMIDDFENYIRSLPPTRSSKPEVSHA
jgi:hypothetical protein